MQIQQVLINLMRNAMEAMRDSPRRDLVVRTRPISAERMQVEVEDTGPGISEEIASQLFQPFDAAGRRHMEYLRDRGARADVPVAEIIAAFAEHYPGLAARRTAAPTTTPLIGSCVVRS